MSASELASAIRAAKGAELGAEVVEETLECLREYETSAYWPYPDERAWGAKTFLELIEAVGEARLESACPILGEILVKGHSVQQPAAARAFGEIGGLAAVGQLLRRLDEPDYWGLPTAAVLNALATIGDASVADAIVEHLHEFGATLTHSALCALTELGDRRAVPL